MLPYLPPATWGEREKSLLHAAADQVSEPWSWQRPHVARSRPQILTGRGAHKGWNGINCAACILDRLLSTSRGQRCRFSGNCGVGNFWEQRWAKTSILLRLCSRGWSNWNGKPISKVEIQLRLWFCFPIFCRYFFHFVGGYAIVQSK